MLENVQGLKPVVIRLDGGVDEESPTDGLLQEDAVKMTNWRLSRDGKRIQKRAGLDEEGLVAANEDVYGYATYTDSSGNHCQLAALEGQLMRKVGAGAWAQIYDWPSSATIDHTVKILEIQDKQFIITEKGSRVILSDGSVGQVGVSPPTTLPTATPQAISGVSPPLNEYMVYASQAAMNAVWTDGDTGTGASTWTTTDPGGNVGPDADSDYMRLYVTGSGATDIANRYRSLSGFVGKDYTIDLAVYMVSACYAGKSTLSGFHIYYDDGDRRLHFSLGVDGLFCYADNGWRTALVKKFIPIGKWIKLKIQIKKNMEFYSSTTYRLDVTMEWDDAVQKTGILEAHYPARSTSEGYCSLRQYRAGNFYIDHIIIATDEAVTAAALTGHYKYAVSFIRGTNYICESNPVRSAISSVTFSGIGPNDMTVDSESEYTGDKTRVYKIQITSPLADEIRWSEDNGSTWIEDNRQVTSEMVLSYGVIINFATTSGHQMSDAWTFTCSVSEATPLYQAVRLSSIPTSADTTVTGRKIYRTNAGGSEFYYLTTIEDNTTTTYDDSKADAALGELMTTDHDLFTDASTAIGKFAEWWDNRLWIADHSENLIYYSAVRDGGAAPCEFDIANRFIPVNRGDQDDVITALKAYKDALYVFKPNDIFIIQKTSSGYGIYHLNSDLGCIADNCVCEVNDFLMFPSQRQIELYDGVRSYHPAFSVAVTKTFLTADPAGFKYMSIAHDKQYNEVWLSIPGRLSGAAAITIVWNYIRNKFYFFQFYKTPSVLARCKDLTGKSVLKMGTRDGYICLCDYGYADEATAITATYRKGWIDMIGHGVGRLLKTDYELPASMTITANIYVDMQTAVFRTYALTGDTPGATDIEQRRIISDKAELGTRHRYIAVEYANAENCGGDCKINQAVLWIRPDVVKNKVSPD